MAARLSLSDGRRMFAKVVGREPNPDSPDFHRAEARILNQMPPGLPVPRLSLTYDDGDWVGLFTEEIDGRTPDLPWSRGELLRVVKAMESLIEMLTPCPFPTLSYADRHRRMFSQWHKMSQAQDQNDDELADLNPWARRHLNQLCELESRLDDASAGNTLLHSDLRADNILIGRDRVYFVDWPSACVGAGWIDLLSFLPSVAMQGGPRPWTIFDQSTLCRDANEDDVTSVLSGVAGFFIGESRKPPPPGLSTLRAFQRAQGVEALSWLRHRLGVR
ncbi:MAG: phosphotransferase [Thermoplasmata archaeon]